MAGNGGTRSPTSDIMMSTSQPSLSQALDDEEAFYSSPTRVLDFECSAAGDTKSYTEEDQLGIENFSGHETTQHEPPEQSSIYRKLIYPEAKTQPARRARQPVQVLPTLEESASDSSDEASLEQDEIKDAYIARSTLVMGSAPESYDRKNRDIAIRKKPDRRPVTVPPRNHFDRIQEIVKKASELASTGCEEQAIQLYRKALHIDADEISRIRGQMQCIDGKHPSTVESIYTRLREDWVKVNMSVASIRLELATLNERLGNYRKALSSCREAANVYKRHAALSDDGPAGVNLSKCFEETTAILERMKASQASFEDRKKMHAEIIALRLKSRNGTNEALLQKAVNAAIKLKEIEVSTLGSSHPQVANTCLILSELAKDQGIHDAALKFATEALRVSEISLGRQHPQTGKALLHLARLHSGDEKGALRYYNQALEVYRPLTLPPGTLATILNEKAVIDIRLGNLAAASESLREAVDSCSSDFADNSNNSSKKLTSNVMVQLWRNLAECHVQKREYDEASRNLIFALNVQRDVRRLYDSLNQNQLGQVADDKPIPAFATDSSLAETLRRLGKVYRGMGKFEEASKVLREAIQKQRIAVARATYSKKIAEKDKLPEKQDELATSLYCLAEVCLDTKDCDGAFQFFGDSLQLRLFSDANRQGQRINMIHCAMCLVGMGNVHMKKGEYKVAFTVYGDALSYCSAHGVPADHVLVKMIKDKRRETELAQSVKIEEEGLADLLKIEKEAYGQLTEGKLDHGVETLSRAMAMRRALLKLLKSTGRDSTKLQHDTACALDKFGDILTNQGNKVYAQRAYCDSIKLFKKCEDTVSCEAVSLKLEAIQGLLN